MGIILYICLMVTKACHIIRLLSLALLLVVASYFKAPTAVMEGVEDYPVQTPVVKSIAGLELKVILESVMEIGNVNPSFRIGSVIKKEGWSTFYDLSPGAERQLFSGKTVFSSFHHHTPLYISYRKILI